MSNTAALAVAKEFIDSMYATAGQTVPIAKLGVGLRGSERPFARVSPATLRHFSWMFEDYIRRHRSREEVVQHITRKIRDPKWQQELLDLDASQRGYDGRRANIESLVALYDRQRALARRCRDAMREDAVHDLRSNPLVWNRRWMPSLVYKKWWRGESAAGYLNRYGIWFVGLPGSGKTTLAAALYLFLLSQIPSGRRRNVRQFQTVMIDGDMERNSELMWAPGSGFVFTSGGRQDGCDFTTKSRRRRMKSFARFLDEIRGIPSTVVIGSAFCPLESQRLVLQRAFFNFLIVYVNTPRAVCEERRKESGFYTDPQKNPGIKTLRIPDEHSKIPATLTIDTSSERLWMSIERITGVLEEMGWFVHRKR